MTAHDVEQSIRRFAKRDDGQVLPLFAILAYALVQVVFGTYNVGEVIEQKIRLQNAMDAGAYSEAVWEARTYNLMAYINRANVANTQTVFWITTNKSVYDCLSGSNFDTATTMVDSFVDTFLSAISATIIGAAIAEPFRLYWKAGFTIGYKNIICTAYEILTGIVNFADTGELLKKGFQIANVVNHLRQFSMYGAMADALRTGSIAESVAAENGVEVEVNEGLMGQANAFGNIYRYQAMFSGVPWDLNVSNDDYKRLKHMIATSMEPFSTGSAAPAHTMFKAVPPVLEMINLINNILSSFGGIIGIKDLKVELNFGHTTETELSKEEFNAKTFFTANAVMAVKVVIDFPGDDADITIANIDERWGVEDILPGFGTATGGGEDTTFLLSGDPIYRFVEYKKPSPEYLDDPKVIDIGTMDQSAVENSSNLLPLNGPSFGFPNSPSGNTGGAQIPDSGLQALAAARAIYIGPRDEEGNPSMFLPYWHARPAQILGATVNSDQFKDADSLMTAQAVYSADERWKETMIGLEYLNP